MDGTYVVALNPGVTAIINSTAETLVAETESMCLPTPQYSDLQVQAVHHSGALPDMLPSTYHLALQMSAD